MRAERSGTSPTAFSFISLHTLYCYGNILPALFFRCMKRLSSISMRPLHGQYMPSLLKILYIYSAVCHKMQLTFTPQQIKRTIVKSGRRDPSSYPTREPTRSEKGCKLHSQNAREATYNFISFLIYTFPCCRFLKDMQRLLSPLQKRLHVRNKSETNCQKAQNIKRKRD